MNIDNRGLVLLFFSADWCYKCKMLDPICKKISNNLKMYKINTDDNKDICKKYGVMSIPTLILLKDGNEIKRNVGLISEEKLKEFLDI